MGAQTAHSFGTESFPSFLPVRETVSPTPTARESRRERDFVGVCFQSLRRGRKTDDDNNDDMLSIIIIIMMMIITFNIIPSPPGDIDPVSLHRPLFNYDRQHHARFRRLRG
jgi:hypothetical protein